MSSGWHGPMMEIDPDPDIVIARMEIASTKVCGWCGRKYDAWMDLDEWVCFLCSMHPEELP